MFYGKNSNDQTVLEWLSGLFGGANITSFDETEEGMEVLKKMMSKNIEAERGVNEVIKTEQMSLKTFKERTAEMKLVLDKEIAQFSPETVERVEAIALTALKLNLKEPTLTNFLFGIQEAENKEMENKEKQLLQDYHISCMKKRFTKISCANEKLRRDIKMLQNAVKSQEQFKDKNLDAKTFFQKKIQDYAHQIQNEEIVLENEEYDPSLQHHILVKKHVEVQELEKEVLALQSKLDGYKYLPPNETLTRFKVEEMRNVLSGLEKEFQGLLEMFEASEEQTPVGL